MAKPLVSVVVVTHNGERFVARQLLSVLNQTRTPDRVVMTR